LPHAQETKIDLCPQFIASRTVPYIPSVNILLRSMKINLNTLVGVPNYIVLLLVAVFQGIFHLPQQSAEFIKSTLGQKQLEVKIWKLELGS